MLGGVWVDGMGPKWERWGDGCGRDDVVILFMSELKKYRRLGETLGESEWAGTLGEQAQFYFRQLQRLEIDLLVGQIETAEQRRQIAALQSKIELIREQQRPPDHDLRRPAESSSEQPDRPYCCPLKECGKRFQKQSGLRLHSLLAHSPAKHLREGAVLKLTLEEEQ